MPYRIDFIHGRGHEMTLDKEGGIGRGDLDELDINMLKSQRVPCLLPVEWVEMDGRVTFRYALSGKKMLLHRLQQEPLTMQQFYGLLLRVASALLECRDYMLRPEGCLLGDTFMFVGDNLEDLSFVYVPLISRKDESDQGDDLLAMVARWTAYVEAVDGEGLRNILQLFNANRWPIVELRRLLLEMLGKQRPNPAIAAPSEEKPFAHAVESSGQAHSINGTELPPETSGRRLSEIEDDHQRNWHAADRIELAEEEDAESKKKAGSRRWTVGAAFVLGAACVWRFVYLSQPSSQTMLISAGLTLLLLVGAALLWRKGSELLIASPVAELEAPGLAGSFELQSGPLPMKQRWRHQSGYRESDGLKEIGGATTNSIGNYSLPPRDREEKDGRRPLLSELDRVQGTGHDQMLNQGREREPASELETGHRASPSARAELEPTTLLSIASDESPLGAVKAMLRRTWNGKEEEIPILADVFQIGRVNAGNGYEEKAEGVSRLHLEIVKEQGCHVAKDLGSRNGSLLNGTLMIPYKSYPLAAGDAIQLAGSKGPSYLFGIK